MTRIHEMFPDKHMYFTEGEPPAHLFGPSEEQHPEQPRRYPPYGTDWTRWSSSFTGMLRYWARCICVWNLLLDENGRPDITNPPRPMHRGGLVSIDSKTQALHLQWELLCIFRTTQNSLKEVRASSHLLAICLVSTTWRPRTRTRVECLFLLTATKRRNRWTAGSEIRSLE
jgi:hypothetical protein